MNTNKSIYPVLALLVLGGVTQLLASLPEPSTLFYGKVIHREYGHEHQLFEGSLAWTLRDQAGHEFTYTTELENIGDLYSYRIAIPHQALSTGLSVDPSVIPLGVGEARYEFVSIEINGYPATILWSDIDFLSLIQDQRAATYRIDLAVSFDLLDTDGDGMPDWWEQLYGLDWQTPNANEDPDGDGLLNLNENYTGTDPLFDNRSPTVQTTAIAAYGESYNGVWLRTVDIDTPPASLVFSLAILPEGGQLVSLATGPDGVDEEYVFVVGDTFTQEQLNQGRIAYVHLDYSVTETRFAVTLSDGIHDPVEAEIEIDVFPDGSFLTLDGTGESSPAWWRDDNLIFEAFWSLRKDVLRGDLVESALLYLLGKEYGWTLWDQRYQSLPVTLEMSGDASHIILGGDGYDTLKGGPQYDILFGGPGVNTLFGGAGVDLFIVGYEGEEIIEDFNLEEDILDLSELLQGYTGSLDAFLQVSLDGNDTLIGVNQAVESSGYTDVVIRLKGLQLSQEDLHRLWSVGQLWVGYVRGLASLSIEAWPTDSLEEGYAVAELLLRRNGPTDLPLTALLNLSGSALNGIDYLSLTSTATFGIGEDTATVTIEPLPDGAIEGEERLILSLASGSEYLLGASVSGQISIIDAKQRFNIQALQRLAVANSDPAHLLITREGPMHTQTSVFLDIGGSGLGGYDYNNLPTIATFTAHQTDLVIPVNALDGGALGQGENSRSVTVEIMPAFDDAYRLGDSAQAKVFLMSDAPAFESWVVETFAEFDLSMELDDLMLFRSPRTGLSALLEYAFSYGLDLEDGISAEELDFLLPQILREEDGFHIEFTRRLDDNRLEYVLECSTDLRNWHQGPGYFAEDTLSEDQVSAGRVRSRVLNSETLEDCFVRVRVNLSD